MESKSQRHLIDKLRTKMHEERSGNKSPTNSNLKSPQLLPALHKRSTTDTSIRPEPISRDVSHQLDSLSKQKSSAQIQEQKLKEILGQKPKKQTLPQSLKEIEKAVQRNFDKQGKKKIFSELEMMKLQISKHKEKLLKNVVSEGGLLYRTQSGLILPQLTGMYESLIKKAKNGLFTMPRPELDLGNPSGRKEVEIIIGWLENMIQIYVIEEKDLVLEEKVKRASMIYTLCFKEVVRQVANHCIERGILLQKIWNAQIDIYCTKEDEKIKKIEELQVKFAEILKKSREKYEGKIKNLESSVRSLSEKLMEKEKENLALKAKIDEIKGQNEKDRHALIMSFSKTTNKKNLAEWEEATLHLVEKKIKPGVPVVMVGYFDFAGGFHKTGLVQNFVGRRLIEEDVDLIIPIFDMKNAYTDLNDFQEYLSEVEEIKDKNTQMPESLNLSVCNESNFTYRVSQIISAKRLKNRKSENYNRISLKVPVPKPRSTSLYLASSKQSPSKSPKSSKKSRKKLNKSNLDLLNISNNFKIIESKVKTPSNIRKNKIFKKFISDKLQNQLIKENKRKSSNLTELNSRLSVETFKVNDKKRISLVDYSDDQDYSENSRISSEGDSEGSEEASFSLKKSKKVNSVFKPRLRGLSKILPKTKSGKLPKYKKNKVKLSIDSNQDLDSELQDIMRKSKNQISVKPRYTIIKTPPLSNSSSDEIPNRNKRKSITENVGLKHELFADEKFKKLVEESKNTEEMRQESKNNEEKRKYSKKGNERHEESVHRESKVSLDLNKPVKELEYVDKKKRKTKVSLEIPINRNKSQSFSGIIPKNKNFSVLEESKDMAKVNNSVIDKKFIDKLNNVKSANQLKEIFRDFLPEKFIDAECAEKATQTEENAPSLSIKLEIPEINSAISKTPNIRSRRKSFTKIPNLKNSPKFQSPSMNSSLNTSQHLKSHNKKKIKTTISTEEFNLGLILRKLVITHPGQKLFHSILPTLLTNTSNPKLSLKSLMKLINAVYQTKLTLIKENSSYYKYETSMILYDYLMKKYGLKNVAEGHFLQVLKATSYFKSKIIRVFNFSSFLGCEKNEVGVEEWNWFIMALDLIDSLSYGKNLNNDEGSFEQFCHFGVAVQVIHSLFDNKLEDEKVEELINKVNKMKIEQNQSVSKRTSAQRIVENVNIDEFLKECIGYCLEIKEKIKEKFWPGLAKDETIVESEFLEQSKQFKFGDNESLSKLFEKYVVNQKQDDDKVIKVLKIRSFCAIVWENSMLDFRDFNKKQ